MRLHSIIAANIRPNLLYRAVCLIKCKNASVIYVVQKLGGVYCVNDISAKEKAKKESSWLQRENEYCYR